MNLLTGVLAVVTPKAVDSVGDCLSDMWDACFKEEPSFTLKEISKIRKCRSELTVTDEDLAYRLNQHFKLELKVEDYRKLW
jgi:hypothetical protein